MQKIYLLIVCMVAFCGFAMSQTADADAIIGDYTCIDPFTQTKSIIHIDSVSDGTYQGTVIWVEDKSAEKYLGLTFLKNLRFDDKKCVWKGGKINYPDRKGTFKANLSFVDKHNKKLKVRAFWGVSMIGRTFYWYRYYKTKAGIHGF